MKKKQQDTPPSSISGDEITGMDEEGFFYVEEFEEVQLDDDDMEEVTDQEEEDMEMERPEDQSVLVFNKHSGSVFCCDIHPNGKLAVTGAEDDKAFVWSVESGQIVMDCTGHKDSVIFVGFSFDGVYLATADMSGLIKVWKCTLDSGEPQEPWKVVFEYEAEDLTWGLWHFGARVLIFGADSGDIYVFKIPSGDIKVLQGNNSKAECGKLFKDGVRLVVGYEDGDVKIWDLKTSTVLHQLPANVHQDRVTSIDTHPDNILMVTISSDGKAVLTTSSTGKIVGELKEEADLETVAFSPEPLPGFVALGTLNGSVTIWDVARQMERHSCSKSSDDCIIGVTMMTWVKDHLLTGGLDGALRLYEGRSGKNVLTLTGHRSEILDFKYNAQQDIVLTTSDDGTARIFKYEIPVKE